MNIIAKMASPGVWDLYCNGHLAATVTRVHRERKDAYVLEGKGWSQEVKSVAAGCGRVGAMLREVARRGVP